MSRVGLNPIKIEDGVTLTFTDRANQYGGQNVTVKGKLGELVVELRPEVRAEEKEGEVILGQNKKTESPERIKRAYHGLYRTLIANAIEGVTNGYKKELEIVGIGYKAEVQGQTLMLTIGLNHPVPFEIPEGIKVEVAGQVDLKVTGIDKQLVGETAARIRRMKKPEPYKGKGIKYVDEVIKRKEGKTAA